MNRWLTLALAAFLGLSSISSALAQAGFFAPVITPVVPLLTPPPAAAPAKPLALDARPLSLGGALKTPELWQGYKARFITDTGRVVDTGNDLISHSEGQGYAMLLAVAANDRAVFDKVWGWTRANLMVREDQLLAWRWEPARRPAIADMNDASDGDLLVAWALAEAADFWGDVPLRVAARRIAVEVGRKLVIYKTAMGALLLPAVAGFSAEDRADGPVVNLSYWVFPAFARLSLAAPEIDWRGIAQSGLDILKVARFGPSRLPSEWISLKGTIAKPADGFPQQFGYNAIRIPLYLAWAGIGEREHYDPFAAWSARGRGGLVDLATGREAVSLSEAGYSAIGALTLCVTQSTPIGSDLRMFRMNENYYPATLRLIAALAAQMRYPQCLRG